ncbi:histone deacetylase family protein [Caldimonas thermodepolymerans]|jgi:acetoin utilization deacetylase AcuC-like enzyme|uniref:Deacetylase n=1 Tax=Caldimonas thermodepolymerans TaxID=215580 RepID=A0A2S5T1F4_9BURK|nr:histone deacetylase family protein [Caldimonas thermodepolymerans]PPE68776.1 deacetylase [Caldimonas thermodepolymerans]QPC30394.1 histone deacetylase family protein [Caldimonas thermodepolymerans]RDH95657.1 acetoin utilization deacetylase AcuC-like enzyme [Caldimonas thermodepolymerans]TCP03646.1 acetoin utilization deacetylase AcuC-like enzyme [Caldimonas thermodepolymerans]UZG43159.1 histone deacetylase family protein [Caldimonas thermodepolymerans]
MATGYYSHPDCRRHDMGAGHPECPERLDVIEDYLLATGIELGLEKREAPLAGLRDLELAHSAAYVATMKDLMEQVAQSGERRTIDMDTVVCPHTWQAALRAAGAAVAATDAVIDREIENAFCAVRPPGHHATRSQAMGFCFFNNVAVAARHALNVRRLKRVAIVDFDVHHGNGTEDIFAGDERVLMVSFFQHPLYPFSGTEAPADNMVNLPVPAYTRGMEIRELVEALWIPRLERFKPEMIFISAGFDAHREDDLGQLGLVEADYEWITRRVKDVAERHAKGRIVSCLEGGYHLDALARSVAAHVRVLADV